jgi:hypothetical protein
MDYSMGETFLFIVIKKGAFEIRNGDDFSKIVLEIIFSGNGGGVNVCSIFQKFFPETVSPSPVSNFCIKCIAYNLIDKNRERKMHGDIFLF